MESSVKLDIPLIVDANTGAIGTKLTNDLVSYSPRPY